MASDKLASRGEIWEAAKTDYLDISQPKPTFADIARKYHINIEQLMRCAVHQGWDDLRAKAEAAGYLAVTPEARSAVVKQVDTQLLSTAAKVCDEAGATFLDMLRQVRAMDTETIPGEDGEEYSEVDTKTKKMTRKSRPKLKPSLSSKISMLNSLLSGFGAFAKDMHAIGYLVHPEAPAASGESLAKAIPISAPTPPPLIGTPEPKVGPLLPLGDAPALPEPTPVTVLPPPPIS